jgi:hypothetical protein
VHRLALLLAFGAFALPPSGAATTEPSLIVGVKVTLRAHAVNFSATRVARGYYVQFDVRNTTSQQRTFTLASRSIVVPAHRNRFLAIFFDARGRYRYMSRTHHTVIRGTFRIY